ncbi:hypothetical protein HDV00_011933 [Rhizophlyctis rosea]|nr:hypothetical protein HDV00_011933 [Rhizophlyctis rosea]
MRRDDIVMCPVIVQRRQGTRYKEQYMHELESQIREKKEKQARENATRRMEDEKKEQEMAQYNPFGRSGAGAPARNQDGTISGRRMQLPPQPHPHPRAPPPGSMYPPSNTTQQGGEYATQDIFANGNFIEQVRGLASSMSHHPTIDVAGGQSRGGAGGTATHMPTPQHPLPDQSFVRGRVNMDSMPPWQRDDLLRKQRLQQDQEDGLKRQMAEREAEKARQRERQRKEDEADQARLVREQVMLKERYAREIEEAKRKEEEARKENERVQAERAAKLKAQEAARNEYLQKQREKEDRERDAAGNKGGASPHTARHDHPTLPPAPAPVAEYRSNSPPIPTIAKKMRGGAGGVEGGKEEDGGRTGVGQGVDAAAAQAPERAGLPQHHSPRQEVPSGDRPSDGKGKPLGRDEEDKKGGTQAVLEQLNAIQKELEQEDRKIRNQILSPVPPPTIPPATKPARRPSIQRDTRQHTSPPHLLHPLPHTKRTESRIRAYSPHPRRDPTNDDQPSPNPLLMEPSVLEQQRLLIVRQEKELDILRNGERRNRRVSRDSGVGTGENHSSRHKGRRPSSSGHYGGGIHSTLEDRPTLKLPLLNSTTTPLPLVAPPKTNFDINPPNPSPPHTRSESRRRRRERMGTNTSTTHQHPPSPSRPSTASSLDIPAIKKLNEERLRRLEELEQRRKERRGKGGDGTAGGGRLDKDILLAFLEGDGKRRNDSGKRAPLNANAEDREIPASDSVFKSLDVGRGGVDSALSFY